MMNSHSFNNLELLKVAKETAEQKGLKIEVIIKAVEESIESASRRKYGNCKIKAIVDKKTGNLSIYRKVLVTNDKGEVVVNDDSNELAEDDYSGYKLITLSEALIDYPNAMVGSVLLEQLPPIDLDYSSAKIAKQKVAQTIMEEERKKQYEEYKDSIGNLIYGTVSRIEPNNNIIVDLNRNEALLPASSIIKGEAFRQGDKIKAYIEDVRRENFGAQIFLSRVSKGFMEQLLKQEVPEIYDGIVTVKAIARDPGSRSKVAVFSNDRNIDPVGACVGTKGRRIQYIISELNGEKVDVIQYSPELGEFVVNAIAPAKVSKVVIYEDKEKIEIIVPEDQMSLAIGRHGQNIRLASELVGCKIDILGDEEDSSRKTKEFNSSTKLFVEELNVEEVIGQLLCTEGFLSIEDIQEASVKDITTKIEAFDEEIAIELKNRAEKYLNDKKEKEEENLQLLFIKEIAESFPQLKNEDIVLLYNGGIKKIEDIANLSACELREDFPGISLNDDGIESIILDSRKKLGWI